MPPHVKTSSSYPPSPTSLPSLPCFPLSKLISEIALTCCCCQVAFMASVYVSEMKQNHMPLSSGGSIMEKCYLLSHTHPLSTHQTVILRVCVCHGVGKSLLSLLYTVTQSSFQWTCLLISLPKTGWWVVVMTLSQPLFLHPGLILHFTRNSTLYQYMMTGKASKR